MKFTFNPPQTAQSFNQSSDQSNDVSPVMDKDDCITLAWLDLVANQRDENNGDEWLYLCDDISEGEIYRDWFLWYDEEVTQQWEAYDSVTNLRYVADDLNTLKSQIDLIENSRTFINDSFSQKIA
ncbi:MAG: hypothetical protein ACRCT1_17650 [Microcoleaceae cyanobacterium]